MQLNYIFFWWAKGSRAALQCRQHATCKLTCSMG